MRTWAELLRLSEGWVGLDRFRMARKGWCGVGQSAGGWKSAGTDIKPAHQAVQTTRDGRQGVCFLACDARQETEKPNLKQLCCFSESSADPLLPSFLPSFPPRSCPFQPPLKLRLFQEATSCFFHQEQGCLLRGFPPHWLDQFTGASSLMQELPLFLWCQ